MQGGLKVGGRPAKPSICNRWTGRKVHDGQSPSIDGSVLLFQGNTKERQTMRKFDDSKLYRKTLREPNNRESPGEAGSANEPSDWSPSRAVFRRWLPTDDDVGCLGPTCRETVLDVSYSTLARYFSPKGFSLTWSEPVRLLATCRSFQRLNRRLVLLLRWYIMAQLCGVSSLGPCDTRVKCRRSTKGSQTRFTHAVCVEGWQLIAWSGRGWGFA